jgi:fructokinase
MLCVTKGENGAILYCNGEFYEHPGFKVNAVDTVGAGDAFLAGLIASLLNKKEPADALAFACATGAFVASKAGATPEYDMTEINTILINQ